MNSLAEVRNFLSQKRIAIVGVSRNPKDFSHTLFKEFVARGYDTVAVNPNTTQMNGWACFARIQDVTPPPEAALLMTSLAVMDDLLHDWPVGIRHVWVYGTSGRSKVSPSVISRLRHAGIGVVNGECPLMFLKDSTSFHRFHGFVRKVFRSYPA